MSYEKFYPGGWQSGESGGTPITPEALNHIENGIKALDQGKAPAGALPVSGGELNNDTNFDKIENNIISWVNPWAGNNTGVHVPPTAGFIHTFWHNGQEVQDFYGTDGNRYYRTKGEDWRSYRDVIRALSVDGGTLNGPVYGCQTFNGVFYRGLDYPENNLRHSIPVGGRGIYLVCVKFNSGDFAVYVVDIYDNNTIHHINKIVNGDNQFELGFTLSNGQLAIECPSPWSYGFVIGSNNGIAFPV